MAERRSIQVPCPTCGQRTAFGPDNPWRPFCSERCRGIDLGAWASESYRVAAQADPGDEERGDTSSTAGG
jgi:endogenous inhibitor of DNA gyrase (YacG/DUF329 family)